MTDVGSISRAIALAATEAARDKQATDVVVLDVAELLSITDYFVICSASSDRQIKTVIQAIEEKVRRDLDLRPVRREGESDAGWALLDYVDVVVHDHRHPGHLQRDPGTRHPPRLGRLRRGPVGAVAQHLLHRQGVQVLADARRAYRHRIGTALRQLLSS